MLQSFPDSISSQPKRTSRKQKKPEIMLLKLVDAGVLSALAHLTDAESSVDPL